MNEFERIAWIRGQVHQEFADGDVGVGDDAAVCTNVAGTRVFTVDASIEETHFRCAFASADVLAARAVQAAISDLAAMGATFRGRGTGVLFALALPRNASDDEFRAWMRGAFRAAETHQARVLGGNLAACSLRSLTTTVVGSVDGTPLLRSGARVGDDVYVTGVPGAAALGLQRLLRGELADANDRWVRAWCEPTARIREGERLLGVANCCIDVSDGLVQDAGHLARASGVTIVLDARALPEQSERDEGAKPLSLDADELTWRGGEDYELCFTVPGGTHVPAMECRVTRVGTVTARTGEDVLVLDRRGRVCDAVMRGHNHF